MTRPNTLSLITSSLLLASPVLSPGQAPEKLFFGDLLTQSRVADADVTELKRFAILCKRLNLLFSIDGSGECYRNQTSTGSRVISYSINRARLSVSTSKKGNKIYTVHPKSEEVTGFPIGVSPEAKRRAIQSRPEYFRQVFKSDNEAKRALFSVLSALGVSPKSYVRLRKFGFGEYPGSDPAARFDLDVHDTTGKRMYFISISAMTGKTREVAIYTGVNLTVPPSSAMGYETLDVAKKKIGMSK